MRVVAVVAGWLFLSCFSVLAADPAWDAHSPIVPPIDLGCNATLQGRVSHFEAHGGLIHSIRNQSPVPLQGVAFDLPTGHTESWQHPQYILWNRYIHATRVSVRFGPWFTGGPTLASPQQLALRINLHPAIERASYEFDRIAGYVLSTAVPSDGILPWKMGAAPAGIWIFHLSGGVDITCRYPEIPGSSVEGLRSNALNRCLSLLHAEQSRHRRLLNRVTHLQSRTQHDPALKLVNFPDALTGSDIGSARRAQARLLAYGYDVPVASYLLPREGRFRQAGVLFSHTLPAANPAARIAERPGN